MQTEFKEMTKAQREQANKVVKKLHDRAEQIADEVTFEKLDYDSSYTNWERDNVLQFKRGDVVYEMAISIRREDRES